MIHVSAHTPHYALLTFISSMTQCALHLKRNLILEKQIMKWKTELPRLQIISFVFNMHDES